MDLRFFISEGGRKWFVQVILCLSVMASVHGRETVLLRESFSGIDGDFLTTEKNAGSTPALDQRGVIQGRGGVELCRFKEKPVLVLDGLVQVSYPTVGNLDFTGGELNLGVGLNFQPESMEEKDQLKLREQYFLTVQGAGAARIWVYYSFPEKLCFQIQSSEGKIIFDKRFKVVWGARELHSVRIRWGAEIELFLDGDSVAREAWKGLLNSDKIDPNSAVLFLGSDLNAAGTESSLCLSDFSLSSVKGSTP